MRAEEFDKATIEELLAHANQCFDLAQSPLAEQVSRRAEGSPVNLSDPAKLRLLLEAQFYLTAVGRKRDEEVARRDYRLEIWVIFLIGIEIILSVVGMGIGISEAGQQSRVLSDIQISTKNATSAMTASSDSLQKLAEEQSASLDRLRQMNESLQESLTRTGAMALATRKQLQNVQDEASRATKKPKLELYVSSVLVTPGALLPAKARESAEDRCVYDVVLKNAGEATATKGLLRINTMGKDTWLESSARASRASEPAESEIHTFLIRFDSLRPNVQIPMSLTIGYTKGQQTATMVNFSVDVEELPAGTPLGTLVVVPPQKPAK